MSFCTCRILRFHLLATSLKTEVPLKRLVKRELPFQVCLVQAICSHHTFVLSSGVFRGHSRQLPIGWKIFLGRSIFCISGCVCYPDGPDFLYVHAAALAKRPPKRWNPGYASGHLNLINQNIWVSNQKCMTFLFIWIAFARNDVLVIINYLQCK